MGVVTKKILILGSTGSIGTQALDVIADNSDKFEVVGIAAGGSQPDLVISQAQQLGLAADKVAVADAQAAAVISKALGGEIISGTDAAKILVETTKADTVLNALVGSLGLAATLATLESGAHLAWLTKNRWLPVVSLLPQRQSWGRSFRSIRSTLPWRSVCVRVLVMRLRGLC